MPERALRLIFGFPRFVNLIINIWIIFTSFIILILYFNHSTVNRSRYFTPQLRFKLNYVYVVVGLDTLCLKQFAVHMWCTQYAWISYSAVHLYLSKQLHCTTVLASASLASVLSTNHIPDPSLQHHCILTQPFYLAV